MKYGDMDAPNIIDTTWEVVHDSGELSSAASSYTITGLDGDNDIAYTLICRLIDDTTVGDYKLTFNTDTGSNYGYQEMKGVSTTASATRATAQSYWGIGQTSTDDYHCFSSTTIYAKSGTIRTGVCQYAYDITGTTVTGIVQRGFVWNNSADNITQMVITATADNINAGSRFILLKKRTLTSGTKTGLIDPIGKSYGHWQLIYNNTLGSTVDDVTISNLDGNTDVIYALHIRNLPAASYREIYAAFNNDTTNTNYGNQYIRGLDTGVSAARITAYGSGHFLNFISVGVAWSHSLIYAKSGYARVAIKRFFNLHSTVGYADVWGQVWTNTADNITSMRINTDSTGSSGLVTGTHIELWRLNL